MDYKNYKNFLVQYKTSVIFGGVGFVFLAAAVILSFSASKLSSSDSFEIVRENMKEEASADLGKIIIEVAGAVASPGVYEMKETDRIADALNQAGGILETAESDFVTKTLNKAQTLKDGMKIYIPFKGETKGVQTESADSLININSAGASQLESLSGVGEKTAQKIIAGRPYSDINDLLTKKIVAKSVFEKIKDQISVY